MTVISIQQLSVSFATDGGQLDALNEVSFDVPESRIVGIVGESGCGKSTLINAILGLLADNGRITGGQIVFEGRDLTALPPDEMRRRATRAMGASLAVEASATSARFLPRSDLAPLPFVKDYAVDELRPELSRVTEARDFGRGRSLFRQASCLQCHRIAVTGDDPYG